MYYDDDEVPWCGRWRGQEAMYDMDTYDQGSMQRRGKMMEFKNTAPSDGVRVPRSVLIAFHVVDALSQLAPIGVGALARELALPKSTVQRTLRTLEVAGWVYRSTDQARWSLTLKAFQIGNRAARSFDVRDVALPHLQRLRDETKESTLLGVVDGYHTFILAHVESLCAVRAYVEVGETFPMNCTAAGKAFLAAADDDFVEAYLATPLTAMTENSITDPDRLREEIARVRERGYAVNVRESRAEVVSLAAVVRGASGDAVAAVVLTGPATRILDTHIEPLSKHLLVTAERISTDLGWRG